MLAVAFSATMFSCGSADKAANDADSVALDTVVAVEEAVATDTVCGDSVLTDTVVAVAEAVVAE